MSRVNRRRSAKRQEPAHGHWWIWVAAGLLGLVAVVGLSRHGDKSPEQKPAPFRPLSQSQSLSEQAKPVVKSPKAPDKELADRAWKVFVELVNGFEYPEVRQGFVALYENRAMYYNFQDPNEFSSSERGHSALASVFLAEKRGEHFRPVTLTTPDSVIVLVFTFKPERLLETEHSVQYKRATILHEYAHILQLRRGTLPEKWFALVDRRTMPHDSTSIQQVFEAECEAYLAQARYLQEYGNPNEEPRSRAFATGGIIALRRAVAKTYHDNPGAKKFLPWIDTLAENPPPSAGVRMDLNLFK